MKALKPAVFAISTAIACTAALADQSANLPAEHVQGSVHYISGGVGKDESDAMQQAMRHYPLALEFVAKARARNEFLASIPVTIRDARGQVVLKTVSTGPFLLVKDIRPGKYEITAEQGGKIEKRNTEVEAKGGTRLVFEWNAA